MSNNLIRRTEQGDAHSVVIICLVLALIAALGWIFYQNVIHKEASRKDTELAVAHQDEGQNKDTQNKKEDNVPSETTSCMHYEKLCLTYPAGWKYTSKQSSIDLGDGSVAIDVDTLMSPDKAVSLQVENGIGQIGGACIPESTNDGTTEAAQKTGLALAGFDRETQESHLYAVKLVIPRGSGYLPVVALTASKSIVEVGRQAGCNFMYSTLFGGKANQGAGMDLVSVSTDRSWHKEGGEPKTMSFSKAKKKLDSKYFNELYSILQTAHYKR